MPPSSENDPPAPCKRCGHTDVHLDKQYTSVRAASPALWLLHGFVNLVTAALPRRPTCSWCQASRKPPSQPNYSYIPFLNAVPHSRHQLERRRRALLIRPELDTAHWPPESRKTLAHYLHWRDGGLCGLCAKPLDDKGLNIEHVIPKRFGVFDIARGRAAPGTDFDSALHRVDNLQLAHDYCNKAKGNSRSPTDWRHPLMPPLPAATSTTSSRSWLWLPAAHIGATPPPETANP